MKVGKLIIRAQDYDFSAHFLDVTDVAIAQLGTPLIARWVVALDVIKWPMRMETSHVFAELVDVTFHDDAAVWLCG